jgi:hypothetical protein
MLAFILLLFSPNSVSAAACEFSGQTYSSGTDQGLADLLAGSTCTMVSQTVVEGAGTILSISGKEKKIKAIVEGDPLCGPIWDGSCRLLRVKNGATVRLSWVHLRNGRASTGKAPSNEHCCNKLPDGPRIAPKGWADYTCDKSCGWQCTMKENVHQWRPRETDGTTRGGIVYLSDSSLDVQFSLLGTGVDNKRPPWDTRCK